VHRPEATYLAWVDCRALGLNDHDLRRLMIEKARLALNHGPAFGAGGCGFQRFNLACPRATVESACRQLRAAVRGR
jgi:cystathionine beta-lyase